MRILRQEIRRISPRIRKIAAPAAGNQDFPPRFRIVLDDEHPLATPARNGSTHQAGTTGAENDGVICLGFFTHGAALSGAAP